MQKRLALLAALGAVVLVAAYFLLMPAPAEEAAAEAPATTEQAQAEPAAAEATAETGADATAAATEIKDFSIGAADAKVVIVEYASFTCPHCANFHANVYGKLKSDYIDTGKVRFEYHEVYFDRYGLWAAMLARCGGEMKYFGLTDMIFEKQQEWAASDDPKVTVENLMKLGRAAGMEDAAMDACLKDQATAEALVAHFEESLARDYPDNSFKGTPSFIINGVQYGNMSYEDMKVILDAELAE